MSKLKKQERRPPEPKITDHPIVHGDGFAVMSAL